MNPYKHPTCNFTYTAPPGTPPEECGDLPCILDREKKQVTSFWRPEPQERQAIIEGGDIVFTLQGIVHPPISLGVTIPTPAVGEDYHHTYNQYWKPILEPAGTLDLDALKRELHDYHLVMEAVSKAYDEITCGRFSKCTTDPQHIIDEVHRRIAEAVENSPKPYPSPGIQAIAIERQRQLTELGWTAEHDDAHVDRELAAAAATFALHAAGFADASTVEADSTIFHQVIEIWPFDPADWKGTCLQERALAKAGGLIAAELDRLDRIKTDHPSSTSH